MTKQIRMNVRLDDELGGFVAGRIGEDGLYAHASEYVRDLIRRDWERAESERFARLQQVHD